MRTRPSALTAHAVSAATTFSVADGAGAARVVGAVDGATAVCARAGAGASRRVHAEANTQHEPATSTLFNADKGCLEGAARAPVLCGARPAAGYSTLNLWFMC